MRLLFLVALVAGCGANDEETNQLSSTSKTLDTSLRKALLKALTELESENEPETNRESSVEKARASVVSYVEGAEASPEVSTTKAPQVPKQLVVIQKSSGIQHRPITTFEPTGFNLTDRLVSSQTAKIESTSPKTVSINDRLPKIDLTSPAPTVETPTTEESEAKVEDVQFFSAPLVAAFTVHQDESGLPKSVEPIYKSSTNTVPVVTNFIDDQRYFQQDYYARQEQQQLKQENYRNQLALQEKQRALEEQLHKLQKQQRQQQEFLLKQQELIREQERILKQERERNRFKFDDQPFVPIIPNNHNNNNNNIEFTTPTPMKPSTVVFQSSVSFNPAEFSKGSLPLNAQQLPVKNFNDFRQSPYNFNQIQPGYIQHNQIQPESSIQTVPSIQPIQPVPTIQPIHTIQPIRHIQPIQPVQQIHSVQHLQPFQTVQQIQPVLTPPNQQYVVPNQNVRIYRQEHGTSNYPNNFGVTANPHYTHVQIQPSVQIPNVRLLRTNGESYQQGPVQPPLVNHHLRNLLQQAGISKERQEDLNIVSKVLSYNHFGGDNFFAGAPGRTYHFPVHRSDAKV